ncbi:MAG: hypothetical protein ACTSYA_09775 [Candidatus Kariarchaeaceae archaeon]
MNASVLITRQESGIHPLQHISPFLMSMIKDNAQDLLKKKESKRFLRSLPYLTEDEIATGLVIFHSKRFITFKEERYSELLNFFD